MYQFNVEGDMGRHHLSISGASAECEFQLQLLIDRQETFPSKEDEGRIGFGF